MSKILLATGFVVLIGILAALLTVLIDIDRHGVTVNIAGQVDLAKDKTGALGKVDLVMGKPVSLIATGPGNAPIPANLAVATCPKCGGSMVPIRWNPFTGEIVWQCLKCGYTTKDITTNPSNSAGR